jgi:hypothetical protein
MTEFSNPRVDPVAEVTRLREPARKDVRRRAFTVAPSASQILRQAGPQTTVCYLTQAWSMRNPSIGLCS